MKAVPCRREQGKYVACVKEDATHLKIQIPGPIGTCILPIQIKGRTIEAESWFWNGDTEFPTVRPGILREGRSFRCHAWITDGVARVRDNCSLDQTVDLVDLTSIQAATQRH